MKWPSLQAVQKARPETLRQFYHRHGSRSQTLVQRRLQLLLGAIPLSDEAALVDTFAQRVQLIARELDLVRRALQTYDTQIAALFAAH